MESAIAPVMSSVTVAWTDKRKARDKSYKYSKNAGGKSKKTLSSVSMIYTGIILHGVCYDFFVVTGQIFVDKEAPDHLKSSAQGLITFATYGLGMVIGIGIGAAKDNIARKEGRVIG